MSLDEQTYVLGEELQRLNDLMDELAEKLADAEAGTASASMLQNYANNVDTQGGAIAWLIDDYGEDAVVTIRGLDAGEFARVDDRSAAMEAMSDKPGGLPGSRSNVFAAMCLVDAPFLDTAREDVESEDAWLSAKLTAITNGMPRGVAKWVEGRGNDLSTVSAGNWTPLRERSVGTSTDSAEAK